MAVLAALLRGINLGGYRRVKMDALRLCFADAGLNEAQTYLQSGNVIFETTESDRDKLTRRIEAAVQQKFGFHSDVVLRSKAELRRTVGANPFAHRTPIDPAKLLVLFLAAPLSAEEAIALTRINAGPEELSLAASEVYIYYPNGMGRSKLTALLGKTLKTTNTGRNWSSVTNILSLMEKTGSR